MLVAHSDNDGMRAEMDARNAHIEATVVSQACATLKDGQDLRTRVAELVCNRWHSGIDVWSMIKDQPDRTTHWLSYADTLIERVAGHA